MALIDGSKRDLWISVNRETAVPLPFEDLIFSAVVEGEGGVDQTKIRFTAESTYPYRGTFVLNYQRLRLETLPRLLLTRPRITPRNNLYELLPHLKHAIGIKLTEDDVENAPILESSETKNGYEVFIKAKSTSHGWVGECNLLFLDLPPISIPVQTVDIEW